MDVTLRKIEINLRTLGLGVIAFGAWAFVKYILMFFFYGSYVDESLSDNEKLILNIICWIVALLALLIRVYVGVSAQSESKGKRKTGFYIFLTGWLAFLSLSGILLEIFIIIFVSEHLLNLIINMVIDVTSLVIMLELMVNAIRLRKLRKEVARA
ncbi:MAG: hypothetical protein IJJ15_06645 [Ruminococcus sp.]|nr:hypothetical protein [Ruminococcus sp.]